MKSLLAGAAILMAASSALPLWAADKDAEEALEPGMIGIVVPMELQND